MEDFYKPCKSSEDSCHLNNGYSTPYCSLPSVSANMLEDEAVNELHNIPVFREFSFFV